jgi:hypothetical protein
LDPGIDFKGNALTSFYLQRCPLDALPVDKFLADKARLAVVNDFTPPLSAVVEADF